MRMHSAVLALIAITGCSLPDPPTTSVIRIRGTVTAATTRVPIAGAEVILYWSAGAFGTGSEWATTDGAGAYSLARDFGGEPFTCVGMAITAQAAGFKPSFVPPGGLRCVEDVQVFDLALTP